MPISPENKLRYPPRVEWAAIRALILARSEHRCEFCQAENHKRNPLTGSMVVLTIAHLDHQPENNAPGNLRALCQRCHNKHDAAHRAANRRITMAKKTAAKAAPKKNPKGTLMQKTIAFALTPDEIRARAEAAANFANQLAEEDKRFEEVKRDWRAKLTDIAAKRDTNLASIREGKELRNVEVTLVKNYDENRMEYWFEGKMMEEREMKPEERQQGFDEIPPTKTNKKGLKAQRAESDAKAMMMPGATGEKAPRDITEATNDAQQDTADVIKMETSKKTKRSAVDGIKTDVSH